MIGWRSKCASWKKKSIIRSAGVSSAAPMDDALRAQIDTNLRHLDGLIHRGRHLHEALATDPSSSSALAANRVWQQDCGAAVNQLSGGSKAHWLARAYSEAFLVRSVRGGSAFAPLASDGSTKAEGVGGVVVEADPTEIVDRILDVL